MNITGLGTVSSGQLGKTQDALIEGLRRSSSGKSIERASDNAAGLAIAERLEALEAAIGQGVQNLNDGISVAQVADGGLEQVSEGLGRLRELSVQAQNGTLNDADRAVIQQEFDQVTAQIDQIAQSTSFNGTNLLNGDVSAANGGVDFTSGGGGEALSFAVDDQGAAALGVAGLDVGNPATLDAIDAAIDKVGSARGSIGATANRLASAVRTELSAQENQAAARSRIEDADFAKETAELTKNSIIRAGQLGLQSQFRGQESSLLQLLG